MRTLVLHRVSIAAVFVVLSLVLLALASSDATRASHDAGNPQYAPTGDGLFCNDLPDGFEGPAELQTGPCSPEERSAAPNTHPDLTTVFTVPRGHMNLGEVAINTLAPEFYIAQGTAGEGTSDIPEGQVIGGFRSVSTLGLGANPCDNVITPEFVLWNATTDTSNVFTASPEGTPDRFLTLVTDGGDAFPGKADADSPIVAKFPDFGNRLFDPDGSGAGPNTIPPDGSTYDPIRPWARYAGATQVPLAGDWQALQIYVFAPGQLQAAFFANPDNATHPFVRVDAEQGWTHITALNDGTATVISVNPISDYCSVLDVTAALLGNPGGNARLTTPSIAPGSGYDATLQEDGDNLPTEGPPAECGDTIDNDSDTLVDADDPDCHYPVAGIDDEGTYLGGSYSMSLRDADGDGIENTFDTCPFTANIDDPYDNGGGAAPGAGGDIDMIDPACDPRPGPSPSGATRHDPTAAEDGGAPGTCGDTIDNGGGDGADIQDADDCHVGSVSGDIDNDSYSNSQDNCPLVSNNPNRDNESSVSRLTAAPDGGPQGDSIGDPCDPDDDLADGTFLVVSTRSAFCVRADHATADSDNDGWCAGSGADPDDGDANNTGADDQDSDGDAYKEPVEAYMNTDPMAACSVTNKHHAWPPDFNNDKVINILDIVQLTLPTFGAVKNVDPEYKNRLDLNADTVINILDIVQLTPPAFGKTCGTPKFRCQIIRNWDATIDTYCGNGAVSTGTAGNVTTVTVTYGACAVGGENMVAAIVRSNDGSRVEGDAQCTLLDSAHVGPIGPEAVDVDDTDPTVAGNFTCEAKFDVAATPYLGMVVCGHSN